jgi:hypothetical protein
LHQLHPAKFIDAVFVVSQDGEPLIEQRDLNCLNPALLRLNNDLDLANDILVVPRVSKDLIEIRIVVDVPSFSPQLL